MGKEGSACQLPASTCGCACCQVAHCDFPLHPSPTRACSPIRLTFPRLSVSHNPCFPLGNCRCYPHNPPFPRVCCTPVPLELALQFVEPVPTFVYPPQPSLSPQGVLPSLVMVANPTLQVGDWCGDSGQDVS